MNNLNRGWEKDMQIQAQIAQDTEYFVLKRNIPVVTWGFNWKSWSDKYFERWDTGCHEGSLIWDREVKCMKAVDTTGNNVEIMTFNGLLRNVMWDMLQYLPYSCWDFYYNEWKKSCFYFLVADLFLEIKLYWHLNTLFDLQLLWAIKLNYFICMCISVPFHSRTGTTKLYKIWTRSL